MNNIDEDIILYKAKNYNYFLIDCPILGIFFGVWLSSFCTILMHADSASWFLCFILVIFSVFGRYYCFHDDFFTSKLYLTNKGVLVTQNKYSRHINYEDIKLIKQERDNNLRTNLIITLNNDEQIFYPKISNFQYLILNIKKIFPDFNCINCLKIDINREIKLSKNIMLIFILLILIMGIRIFGINFYENKYFWFGWFLPILLLIIPEFISTFMKIHSSHLINIEL